MVIWEGTEKSFQDFFMEINRNQYNISFSQEYNRNSIHFLDLVIFKDNGNLYAKTFYKQIDRNEYVFTSSCHHPKWIGNIPKGQMMRICKICKPGLEKGAHAS